MQVTTVDVGSVRCTRVGYIDVEIEPETVGLTAQQVAAVPWAEPTWARAGKVRAGAAAWIIESGDARIVVDPAQSADAILRDGPDASIHQEAFASALAAAGFARETITHAVATHVDGIGMFAWRHDDGTWGPFFPNATIQISERELDAFDQGFEIDGEPVPGTEALDELRALGAVEPNGDLERVTGEVSLTLTGVHNPGHQVVRIASGEDRAINVGHLALSPLHLATGECALNLDPAGALTALAAIRDEGALLMGPLWPAPGAGRWHDGVFTPVT